MRKVKNVKGSKRSIEKKIIFKEIFAKIAFNLKRSLERTCYRHFEKYKTAEFLKLRTIIELK